MNTVKDTFSAGASAYDRVARIQPLVAARLAASLDCKPARILEIGCGTGVLSSHLRSTFPDAELILTDISPSMLEICKRKLKGNGIFRVMNGERPDTDLGLFDLIISNLAMQWFEDMPGGIDRLSKLLAPGGRFSFSTLGEKNFTEWRALLETRNLPSGLHLYPDIASFPWPGDMLGRVEEEFIIEKTQQWHRIFESHQGNRSRNAAERLPTVVIFRP